MDAKKVIIAGGTGFIGRPLCRTLKEQGYDVYVLSRNPASAEKTLGQTARALKWDGMTPAGWTESLEGSYAVINLAGENVATGRWSPSKKDAIVKSRLAAVHAVTEALEQVSLKPPVLIQASASGFYGNTLEDTVHTEKSSRGKGFLANVTSLWEKSSSHVEKLGIRRVLIRTGIVLGRDGGALPKLLLPYRFFAGGYMGTGRQYMSWIHIEDEIGAILYALENETITGPINLTAPNPVSAAEFSRTLAAVMRRPSWLNISTFAVQLLFGEMGEEALLSGQRVYPEKLLEKGYRFKFSDLKSALTDLIK